MSDVQRYIPSEFMGLAPNCTAVRPSVDDCEFVLASDYDALLADRDRLAAELEAARAAIEAAYREGFSDGAYCFEESAKPEKYVEESWLQSESRAASSAGGPQS